MNERRADIAIVATFVALFAMMVSIGVQDRLLIVCIVIAVAGLTMGVQRGSQPFPPVVRRRLRGLVVLLAAVAAVVLYRTEWYEDEPCFWWLGLVALTAVTYTSLRVRIFAPRPSDVGQQQ